MSIVVQFTSLSDQLVRPACRLSNLRGGFVIADPGVKPVLLRATDATV